MGGSAFAFFLFFRCAFFFRCPFSGFGFAFSGFRFFFSAPSFGLAARFLFGFLRFLSFLGCFARRAAQPMNSWV